MTDTPAITRLRPIDFDQLTLAEAEARAVAYEIAHRQLVVDQRNLQHNRQLLTYRINRLRREAEEAAR